MFSRLVTEQFAIRNSRLFAIKDMKTLVVGYKPTSKQTIKSRPGNVRDFISPCFKPSTLVVGLIANCELRIANCSAALTEAGLEKLGQPSWVKLWDATVDGVVSGLPQFFVAKFVTFLLSKDTIWL